MADIDSSDKPTFLVFNKIDAYSYIKKDEDDLTPITRANWSLEELMNTWMAKNADCIFISAKERTNIEELRRKIYDRVRELHVQRFPYNDFLYPVYDEEDWSGEEVEQE